MKSLKNIVVLFLAYFSCIARSIFCNKSIQVRDIDTTIETLVSSDKSLIRFGDGEIALIRGFDLRFQKYCPELGNRLKQVLANNDDSLMIAIPDVFTINTLKQYNDSERLAWIRESFFSYPIYKSQSNGKCYYNSLVSRLYLPFKCDYKICENRFNNLKQVWAGKDILIVEGKYSRLGVGNDLFSNVNSIKRILCPQKNAYSKIKQIEDAILDIYNENYFDLVILALGPTAKMIVFDLYKVMRLLDLGHIDIEYEWFLRKAKNKISIPGKAVNEAKDGYDNLELELDNERYMYEIIREIN